MSVVYVVTELVLDYNSRHLCDVRNSRPRNSTSVLARIEALYKIKARRVEPVGRVHLWPVTG